ncbi:unnamed protein product, partial [Dibothriocephalus latus]
MSSGSTSAISTASEGNSGEVSSAARRLTHRRPKRATNSCAKRIWQSNGKRALRVDDIFEESGSDVSELSKPLRTYAVKGDHSPSRSQQSETDNSAIDYASPTDRSEDDASATEGKQSTSRKSPSHFIKESVDKDEQNAEGTENEEGLTTSKTAVGERGLRIADKSATSRRLSLMPVRLQRRASIIDSGEESGDENDDSFEMLPDRSPHGANSYAKCSPKSVAFKCSNELPPTTQFSSEEDGECGGRYLDSRKPKDTPLSTIVGDKITSPDNSVDKSDKWPLLAASLKPDAPTILSTNDDDSDSLEVVETISKPYSWPTNLLIEHNYFRLPLVGDMIKYRVSRESSTHGRVQPPLPANCTHVKQHSPETRFQLKPESSHHSSWAAHCPVQSEDRQPVNAAADKSPLGVLPASTTTTMKQSVPPPAYTAGRIRGSRELANLFTPVQKSEIERSAKSIGRPAGDFDYQKDEAKPVKVKFAVRPEEEKMILTSFLDIGMDSEDIAFMHELFEMIRSAEHSSACASSLNALFSHCKIRSPNKLTDLIKSTAWVDHPTSLIPDPVDVNVFVDRTGRLRPGCAAFAAPDYFGIERGLSGWKRRKDMLTTDSRNNKGTTIVPPSAGDLVRRGLFEEIYSVEQRRVLSSTSGASYTGSSRQPMDDIDLHMGPAAKNPPINST